MTRARLLLLACLVAAGCSHRRYTCAEILGAHPVAGSWELLPPGYSVVSTFAFTLDGQPVVGRPDFSVWDEHRQLVCDAQGKDVAR
jgi:hypothetical protein